jgi:hypothetical protein
VADRLPRSEFRSTLEPLAKWRAPLPQQLFGNIHRLRVAWTARRSDVTVVQKEPVNPPAFWPLIATQLSRSQRLVWDVDDAVWIGRPGARRMATRMARTADVVVAGNELIATWARSAGAADVVVIPTCYSPTGDVPTAGRTDGPTRYVWIGSPATAELLVPMSGLLEELLHHDEVELTTIGGPPPLALVDHPRVTTLDWSPEVEHDELSRADYGLALQPRTEYADHKCGFKIVQYMAYGVVPVATANPVHDTIVGELGILIDPANAQFADMPAMKPSEEQRDALRRRWASNYSMPVAVGAWAELLRGIAE